MTLLVLTTLILGTTALAARPPHHSRGYLLAAQLNRALARTPMRGTGFALVLEARRYRLHPAFIAAIAGTESSYGAAACSSNPYNAYGLASCGHSWHVPYFRSWRESFAFMARFLTSRWPHARTPWDYPGYAACSSCWGSRTAQHMRELGYQPTVRYPNA